MRDTVGFVVVVVFKFDCSHLAHSKIRLIVSYLSSDNLIYVPTFHSCGCNNEAYN